VRALHDPPLLRALGQDFARLGAVERMGLLGHQWAGVRASCARLGDWLDLVARLASESEPQVLGAAHGPLGWLVDQVVPKLPDAQQARLRSWLAAIFAPAFERLDWKPAKGESEDRGQLRGAVLSILGGLADDGRRSPVSSEDRPCLKPRRSTPAWRVPSSSWRLAAATRRASSTSAR
jgi:hypothetical protein